MDMAQIVFDGEIHITSQPNLRAYKVHYIDVDHGTITLRGPQPHLQHRFARSAFPLVGTTSLSHDVCLYVVYQDTLTPSVPTVLTQQQFESLFICAAVNDIKSVAACWGLKHS